MKPSPIPRWIHTILNTKRLSQPFPNNQPQDHHRCHKGNAQNLRAEVDPEQAIIGQSGAALPFVRHGRTWNRNRWALRRSFTLWGRQLGYIGLGLDVATADSTADFLLDSGADPWFYISVQSWLHTGEWWYQRLGFADFSRKRITRVMNLIIIVPIGLHSEAGLQSKGT